MTKNKVLRFAPSPTGNMHLGNCRTALLNYYEAVKNNGEFFLRIDDTDSDRDKESYEHMIHEDLKWLGVQYTKVIKQSERNDIYETYFEKLVETKQVYECFEDEDELLENSIYDRRSLYLSEEEKIKLRRVKQFCWRFLLKQNTYKIEDGIMGKMVIQRNWSDPIIKRGRRDTKSFTYNFTSAIDDMLMGVTDVIRAQEHFYNATIQQEIIDALGGQKIKFYHLPVIVNSDGHKLSKREGALSISTLRKEGYHPMTIVSMALTLGTKLSPLISTKVEDQINHFNLKTFSKNSPQFAKKNLTILNKKILKILYDEEVLQMKFDLKIWHIIKDNIFLINEYYIWEQILKKENLFMPFKKQEILWKVYKNNVWDISILATKEEKRDFCNELRLSLTGCLSGPELDKILDYKLNFIKIKNSLMNS